MFSRSRRDFSSSERFVAGVNDPRYYAISRDREALDSNHFGTPKPRCECLQIERMLMVFYRRSGYSRVPTRAEWPQCAAYAQCAFFGGSLRP
jgi:hypothetical protein